MRMVLRRNDLKDTLDIAFVWENRGDSLENKKTASYYLMNGQWEKWPELTEIPTNAWTTIPRKFLNELYEFLGREYQLDKSEEKVKETQARIDRLIDYILERDSL